jgi:PAS domain-containing protein
MEIIEVQGAQRLLATFVDITQTKEVQRALRESPQRYRDFVTHSHEGVWRLESERPLPVDLPERAVVDCFLDNGTSPNATRLSPVSAGLPLRKRLWESTFAICFAAPESDGERAESIPSAARGGFRNRTVEFLELAIRGVRSEIWSGRAEQHVVPEG